MIRKPGVQLDDPARLVQDIAVRQLTLKVVDVVCKHIVVRPGLHLFLLSLQAGVELLRCFASFPSRPYQTVRPNSSTWACSLQLREMLLTYN